MALKGNLTDISLVDLIQVFGMSAKTGSLMLNHREMFGGMMWVSKGVVSSAGIINIATLSPIHTGEDAVIEMLQWDDATFTFTAAAPSESYPTTIRRANEWL